MQTVLPLFLFMLAAAGLSIGMLLVAGALAPRRTSGVKEMPYESGMDPIHDTRRRFDVRFHLVAIAFLLFDVELLFLYPWAVASRARDAADPAGLAGINEAVAQGLVESRALVFGEAMAFILLLTLGFIYAWRKGVFQWR